MNRVLDHLISISQSRAAGFLVLVDPSEHTPTQLVATAEHAEAGGCDAILVGGSVVESLRMAEVIGAIKPRVSIPVIIFPGGADQVCRSADAILFTSLLSGRNPEFLIGEQVRGAALVKEYGLEAIPTAYLLIESGTRTSVELSSQTAPLSRKDIDAIKNHALAAKYLGMKLIYLEAGSGAKISVPEEIIRAVRDYVGLSIICGGGIRHPEDAAQKVAAGAQFVVIGNRFEDNSQRAIFEEFSAAIHQESTIIKSDDEKSH